MSTSIPNERLCNFGELAEHLEVSRKTLSSWLLKWPLFPVISKGRDLSP